MIAVQNAPAPVEFLSKIGVRWLTPETTQIFEGSFDLLHCQIRGENLYRGVHAVLMFPISRPNRFISLRYTDAEEKDREIGVIKDLDVFPEGQRVLVRKNLIKYYYEQEITRIYDVKFKYGLLFFDVETKRGRETFMTYWAYDRAQEYGTDGKLLLDIHYNRYVIPNVSALPRKDQNRFTRFVYW